MAADFSCDYGRWSFARQNLAPDASRDGDARAVEPRVNLRELGWTGRDTSRAVWWRELDPGLPVARTDTAMAIREVGAKSNGALTEALRLSGRYSDAECDADRIEHGQLRGTPGAFCHGLSI